jgi:hypothetical protein
MEDNLVIGDQMSKFGKLFSSWEGPCRVTHVIYCNVYMLETLQGEKLPKVLNGRFLKQYYSSVWQDS